MQQRLKLILTSRAAGSNRAIFIFSYLVPLYLFCMKSSTFCSCKQAGFTSQVPEPCLTLMAAKYHSSGQRHLPASLPPPSCTLTSRHSSATNIYRSRRREVTQYGWASKPLLLFREQHPFPTSPVPPHDSSDLSQSPLHLLSQQKTIPLFFRAGFFSAGLANHISSMQGPASAMCRFAPLSTAPVHL